MGKPTATQHTLPAALWGVLRQVSARFSRDGCSLMAAAIAFFGLISLVPLGALAISVCGRMLGSSAAAEQHVTGLLRSSLPLDAPGLEQAIRHFTHPSGRWLVELISALGLLWAGSRLFLTLEDVLTRVWSGHGRGRPLLLRNLIAFAATLAAGLIFLAITLVTTAAAALASRAALVQELPQYLHPAPWLRAVVAPAAAWLMFLLTYKFLPQARARWPEAAIGAAAAAVLWEACRLAFAALLARSAAYGHLYGSLAGAVVVSVWIYLSASIMLLGAELAVVLERQAASEGVT
jgi:membrane protein